MQLCCFRNPPSNSNVAMSKIAGCCCYRRWIDPEWGGPMREFKGVFVGFHSRKWRLQVTGISRTFKTTSSWWSPFAWTTKVSSLFGLIPFRLSGDNSIENWRRLYWNHSWRLRVSFTLANDPRKTELCSSLGVGSVFLSGPCLVNFVIVLSPFLELMEVQSKSGDISIRQPYELPSSTLEEREDLRNFRLIIGRQDGHQQKRSCQGITIPGWGSQRPRS